MAKIKSKHLNSPSINQDGKPIQYGLYPKDLIVDDCNQAKMLELTKQIRTLLRMESNLKRAYEVLLELVRRLNGEINYSPRTDTGNHAMFAYASMLYGTCFISGEGRKRPIDAFDKSFTEKSEHKSYMVYRDKLFGHLDSDHHVRTDELVWVYPVLETEIKPRQGYLMGGRITMLSPEEVDRWRLFTHSTLEAISQFRVNLSNEVNELLGNLEIIEE